MRLTQRTRRSGMTLIEILVVIAIIAILAGLLMAGVMSVFGKGDEAVNRNDITQMTAAVRTFQGKYGVLPLSYIVLAENLSYYNDNTQPPAEITRRQNFLAQLKKIWPRLYASGNVDWNGDGQPNGPYTLDGDQCLVFFLGGIQSAGGGTKGFSTNPANPMQQTGKHHPVLYQFKPKRLYHRVASVPFYSYKDVYGTPFFYHNTSVRLEVDPNTALGLYFKSSNQLFQPFQLVSAGKDKLFGRGTLPATGNGEDDFANFTDARLGAGE